jgi:hypothetical protein
LNLSVCSCRSSFLIFGFTIAESGWPSTRFLISAQEHEPRHPDFIFSAAWSSILLPDSFFPVVPSVCISVVTLLRVSVSVGRVLLPSFPLVLATSRARKPPGLGLLSAVSVRAGESQELIFLVSSHIRWQSQELIFSLPQCFGRLVFAHEPVFPVLDSRAEAAPSA